MTDKKLENLAYRLQDMNSLRNLFSELNFDFEDKPVNKDNWNDEQKQMVLEARVIAKKNDYKIYYIQTDTDSLKQWKGISSKIIKDNQGFCMVCSHNPGGFKWVFSSLSKEFSKSFSETRHVPIDIKPNVGVPKTFVDFLECIRIAKDSTTISIISQISDAFDTFAVQIHDELTVNVFEALKILAEGIISDKSNNLTLNEQTLKDIREPTFILLYRIMFVLYAEDRSIFPEEKFYYDNFSLKWIKNNWILKSDHSVEEYGVHKRIQKLFRLIEMGSEELDYKPEEFFMRSYYGRLFDRKIHSKLEKWSIPNKNLLGAVGLLTRTRDKKGNYFFLDYAALETRHLGAIYEHLLEYHLTVKDGKVDDLPNPKERKSTGSYYTPQYIVDYIVENTVGPLIDNIVKKTDDPSEQVDNILDLNVLDPAMGSGHFLVGATNYIAKRICQIEYGEEVTEQAFVERKRDVARRCVYGVDINPLAVDLASVSLWLETLSSEKPLSFLSAHLKSGNSLIGSSIDDILEKQTTLIESAKGRTRFKKIVRDFIMLETLDDDTAQAVKAKIAKYASIQSKGTTYYDLKCLLDAKVAKSFGVDVPPIGDFVHKIGEDSLDFYSDERWQQVKKVSEGHSFFHWDLEFLDVFYGADGKKKNDPGFDAVVGNPPYVRQELIKEKNEMQLPKNNTLGLQNAIIPSKMDLSGYFYYHSLNILKDKGRLGFITSDSWMSYGYGKLLQQILLKVCKIIIIMKTKFNIFEADTKTVTLILDKAVSANIQNSHNVKIVYVNNKDEFTDICTPNIREKLQNEFVEGNWNAYFSNNVLLPKINMIRMADVGFVRFGKKTGCNDFFILTLEIIRRYNIPEKYFKPIISKDMHEGVLINDNASEYLLNVNESKNELVKTEEGKQVLEYIISGENTKVIPKQGKNQIPCVISEISSVSGRKMWYSLGLQNPPSIFLSQIIYKRLKVYENNGEFYSLDVFAFFTPNNKNHIHAFLAYLASSWFSLYMEQNGHPMGGGALKFQIYDYKSSLIPDFDKMPKNDVENIKKAWRNYREDFDQKKLDSIVLKILGFTAEEIKQVEEELEVIRNKRLISK